MIAIFVEINNDSRPKRAHLNPAHRHFDLLVNMVYGEKMTPEEYELEKMLIETEARWDSQLLLNNPQNDEVMKAVIDRVEQRNQRRKILMEVK